MKLLPALLLLPVLAFAQTDAPKKPAANHHPEGFHELKIGDAAPAFDLLGIDEEKHTLAEYAEAELLMVAFISNHCPTSQAIEGRLKQLVKDYKGKGLRVVGINPNDPAALRADELGYSKYNDSFPEMKRHAKEQEFNFPYLFDGETQAVAKAYGCLATPHVFLFDKERKLRYQGRFDDSRYADAATVTSQDARLAIDALLSGKPVAVENTPPHGCTTKWIEKRVSVAADNEKWEKSEVHVELIDAAGVAALRKNDTKKVRLFNVWATWCGPCVEEFPELVATARKFGLRDFEFISISINIIHSGDHVSTTTRLSTPSTPPSKRSLYPSAYQSPHPSVNASSRRPPRRPQPIRGAIEMTKRAVVAVTQPEEEAVR